MLVVIPEIISQKGSHSLTGMHGADVCHENGAWLFQRRIGLRHPFLPARVARYHEAGLDLRYINHKPDSRILSEDWMHCGQTGNARVASEGSASIGRLKDVKGAEIGALWTGLGGSDSGPGENGPEHGRSGLVNENINLSPG